MLNETNCRFSRNKNGFLQAEIDGREVGRVKLVSSQPLNHPFEYISVYSMEDEEYGMLRHIEDFSDAQQQYIREELHARYFCPSVSEILGIKDKMGSFYFDVMIGTVKKSFTVRDLTKNIRQQDNTVTITDTDGIRYKIEDIRTIHKKSRRKLEPYLY